MHEVSTDLSKRLEAAIMATINLADELGDMVETVEQRTPERVRLENARNLVDAARFFLFAVEDGDPLRPRRRAGVAT